MKRGEVVHLVIFLTVCAVAFFRASLPDMKFKDEDIVIKFDRGFYIEDRGINGNVEILHSTRREIVGRRANVRIYGLKDIPSDVIRLRGSVRVRENRVYITSSSRNVKGVVLESNIREQLKSVYESKTENNSVRGLGLTFLFGESRSILPERVIHTFNATGLAHLLACDGVFMKFRGTLPRKSQSLLLSCVCSSNIPSTRKRKIRIGKMIKVLNISDDL